MYICNCYASVKVYSMSAVIAFITELPFLQNARTVATHEPTTINVTIHAPNELRGGGAEK